MVRKFRSQEETRAADREYYRSLTPYQWLEIFFELQEVYNLNTLAR